MAKKEFTDITIEMCEKELHFKRVTNETLTKFSEKAEKEYNENVKAFVDEVELLDDKRQSLEKRIALKSKQVDIIESKTDATDDELDKAFAIIDEIDKLEDELEVVKAGLLELSDNNPAKDYTKKVDELLAEKVETLLDGITAKEFLTNSTPVDTIKARNLEKYYQLCIVGERQSKIIQEIKEDVNDFLQSQKEIRG
jgi:septal ring factor EnvC (AmiA/AmiB activator)